MTVEEITRKNLRLLLAAFIEKNELTTRRVARAIGCSEPTVKRLLSGRTLPSDEMMKQVGLMVELGFKQYAALTVTQKEQLSQKIGAVGGGVVGFGVVYAAVGSLGLPGMSAAGITSGLAALGVGGGMIAGVLVAAAIPLTAGALVYGAIKGGKYLFFERRLDAADFDSTWEVASGEESSKP